MASWSPAANRVFRRGGRALLDLLYPPTCAVCETDLDGDSPTRLCGECRRLMLPPALPVCRRCAAPIPETSIGFADCAGCQALDLHFDAALALGRYDGRLRDAVLRLKHPGNESLGRALVDLFWERRSFELNEFRGDVLLPIPMHWRRRWRRGVNCPELVAEWLAGRLRLPVANGELRRRRNTEPQSGLSPRQRLLNVRGAFAVRRAKAIAGRRVILIDDVLTTGATCSEAARMLKKAGAAHVSVVVLSRT